MRSLNRCAFVVATLVLGLLTCRPLYAVVVYVDLINSGLSGSGSLAKINAAGGSPTNVNVGGGFDFPNGLIQDASGNFYLANENGTTISRITPAGAVSTFCTLQGTGTLAPYDVAFDSSGNLYVAVAAFNQIQKYNSAGVYQSTITNANFGTPDGLLIDSSGNIYVSNYGVNKIVKLNASGTELAVINADGQTDGMVFDSSGNILVAEPSLGKIQKYDPSTGNNLGSFATGLSGPTDLAYDAAGNLYVVNNNGNSGNGNIQMFSSAGANLGFYATGLNNPTSLVVVAPEPGRAGLLLLGGIVLGARRRRN